MCPAQKHPPASLLKGIPMQGDFTPRTTCLPSSLAGRRREEEGKLRGRRAGWLPAGICSNFWEEGSTCVKLSMKSFEKNAALETGDLPSLAKC